MQKRPVSVVVWLVVFSSIFMVSSNSITDADFWWHLKTGEVIVQERSVPHTDIFSHTAEGRHWTTHEWPAQVILYVIYDLFGFYGVIYATALTAVLTFALIARMLATRGVPSIIVQSSIFLGAVVVAPFIIPRPQIFYFILWAVVLVLLDLYSKGNKIIMILLPVVYVLWANLHASSYLISLLLILFVASELFVASSTKVPVLRRHLGLIVLVAVGTLVSLLNLNTFEIYGFLFKIFNVEDTFTIAEWESFLKEIHAWQAWFLIGFDLIVTTPFLLRLRRKDRPLPIQEALIVFSFIGFSLVTSKFIPLAVIVSVPFLARNLEALLPRNRLEGVPSVFVVLMFALSSVGYHRYLGRSLTSPYWSVPEHATQFVLDVNLPGKMYNTYNLGGYLIWRLFPRYRVFIDGRHEMYEPEVNRDFAAMLDGAPDWEARLARYDVNWLILPPLEVHPGLAASPNWALLYFDNLAAIYLKRSPANQPLIDEYAYRRINPFLPTPEFAPETAEAVIEEYLRSLKANPDIFKSQYDLGLVYLGLGNDEQAEEHLRQAVRIFPKSAVSHYNLAVSLERQGKDEQAQVEYAKAQKLQ